MSHPFSIAENRHHLLLAEAHQVNEFLDARLFAAEVPEDQRLAVAESVLTLALQAREYGVIDALNFFPDLRPGVRELLRDLPTTKAEQDNLAIGIGVAERRIAAGIGDGSLEDDPVTRAVVIQMSLAYSGWPLSLATAVALADGGAISARVFRVLDKLPEVDPEPLGILRG